MSAQQPPRPGRLTRRKVEIARQEVERRRGLGEENVRVTIAENVPRRIWASTTVSLAGCRVVAKWKHDDLFVDVELVDLKHAPRGVVVRELNAQLYKFAWTSQGYLSAGNAAFHLQRADQSIEMREPGVVIRIRPRFRQRFVAPRLVVEVVVQSHTLPAAQQSCREYFEGSDDTRAVLLLKFFWPIRQDGTAASVAISYRRNQDAVDVTDVVSFGSAHLDDVALSDVEEIGVNYRVQGQHRIRDLSGAANANAEIRISGEDLYFEAPATTIPRRDFVLQLAPLFEAYMEGAVNVDVVLARTVSEQSNAASLLPNRLCCLVLSLFTKPSFS